jgi:hypothetical protein
LFPQKFLSAKFLLLLDFAAYQKNKKILAISFCYCSKYISSIKKEKREKQKKKIRSKRRLLDSATEN